MSWKGLQAHQTQLPGPHQRTEGGLAEPQQASTTALLKTGYHSVIASQEQDYFLEFQCSD